MERVPAAVTEQPIYLLSGALGSQCRIDGAAKRTGEMFVCGRSVFGKSVAMAGKGGPPAFGGYRVGRRSLPRNCNRGCSMGGGLG